MDEKMEKMFECNDDDFMARGKDMEELMEVAKMHSANKHGMQLSDEEARAKIREV